MLGHHHLRFQIQVLDTGKDDARDEGRLESILDTYLGARNVFVHDSQDKDGGPGEGNPGKQGFQMLGEEIHDAFGVDSGERGTGCGSIRGMGLLPIITGMQAEKTRKQVNGVIPGLSGIYGELSGKAYSGYEIHMGESRFSDKEADSAQVFIQKDNIIGTYVHGIFDDSDIAATLVNKLAEKKGIAVSEKDNISYAEYKEKQYDMLADILRENMDMDYIYSLL